MKQSQQILTHLKSGKGITALEALQFYGVMRLASRIFELRQDGAEIIKKTEVKRVKFGVGTASGGDKTWARYFLVN